MKRIKDIPKKKLAAYTSKIGRAGDPYQPKPLSKKTLEVYESEVKVVPGPDETGLGNVGEYFRAIYATLGLPYTLDEEKVYHHLGDFDITTSEKALDVIVQVYHSLAVHKHLIYSYREYLDALKRRGSIESKIEAVEKHEIQEKQRYQEYSDKYDFWILKETLTAPPRFYEKQTPELPPDKDIEFVRSYNFNTNTADVKGFVQYIKNVAPSLYCHVTLDKIPLYLEENPKEPHGYFVGTSGSGKSELLKLFIHTYVTKHRYGSVVLIEPSGRLGLEVAHWKEFNKRDRLIYIRPTLGKGMTPVINPFEIFGIDALDYSEKALNVKRVVGQELVAAIGRIVAEGGGFLTPQMTSVLINCVLILLDKPDATLLDLQNLVLHDEKLLKFAQSLAHHEHLVGYFTAHNSGFKSPGNKQTKDAVGRRLDTLLSVGVFRRMTCGKSTFHLEEAVNKKKVIIFDLSKGAIGRPEGAAIGSLVVGMLMGIASRREGTPESKLVPCSIMIDECQNYITDSMEDILTEARKYKMLLNLSQPIAGQRMSPLLKDIVLQTTNLQVVGGTTPAGAKRNAELVGVDGDDVRKLRIGEFYARPNRYGDAIKFKAKTDLLGSQNSVSKTTWKVVLKRQMRAYYRPFDTKAQPTVEAALEDLANDDADISGFEI